MMTSLLLAVSMSSTNSDTLAEYDCRLVSTNDMSHTSLRLITTLVLLSPNVVIQWYGRIFEDNAVIFRSMNDDEI